MYDLSCGNFLILAGLQFLDMIYNLCVCFELGMSLPFFPAIPSIADWGDAGMQT